MEQWILPKVQEWEETIETLGKFSVRYTQTAYVGLAILLQAEYQFLMQTILRVREYMDPAKEDLLNKFLPKLMLLEIISGRLRKLLALGSKREGLGIPNPKEVAKKIHRTSLTCSKRLLESLITGESLSTSEHRACVQQISRDGR